MSFKKKQLSFEETKLFPKVLMDYVNGDASLSPFYQYKPAIPEFKNAIADQPDEMNVVLAGMKSDTMLKKLPPMADIANLAVFLASEMAASITGVTVDTTCGSTSGLNYRFAPMFTNK